MKKILIAIVLFASAFGIYKEVEAMDLVASKSGNAQLISVAYPLIQHRCRFNPFINCHRYWIDEEDDLWLQIGNNWWPIEDINPGTPGSDDDGDYEDFTHIMP
ncbi:MAG: hypothetical protein KDC92_17690 [Bacteroidetes bacterium]|nr:hypothetical protein [Bacteroidota bacterium]